MLKKLCFVLTMGFLLVGCTDESPKDATEENVEKELAEEVVEKRTSEQYLAEFKATPVYQERIQGIEESFLDPVDFEGDEVPEMVLGTNDDITHSVVTIYKLENDQWIEYTAIKYESNMHVYLEPIGKLSYEDGSLKEALAFGRSEAQATSMSQSFSILNYNENNKKIEELVTIPLESTETYSESLEDNKLIINAEDGSTISYIFKNGTIVDEDGNRLGIIIDEDVANITGSTINDHYISLTDHYYNAKSKIKESLKMEEYYEGALCAVYETFYICDYYTEHGGMYAYYIMPKNKVTIEEMGTIFNEPLKIEKWENMMGDGYAYTAEVATESGIYSLEFDGELPDSVLESISYVPSF